MAVEVKDLQKRLNSDKEFRSQFLENPVKALQTVGIALPEDTNRRLIDAVAQLRKRHEPKPGSNLGISPLDIQVRIENP